MSDYDDESCILCQQRHYEHSARAVANVLVTIIIGALMLVVGTLTLIAWVSS